MLKKNSKAALKALSTGIEFLDGVVAVQELFKLETAWAVRKWLKNGLPSDRVVAFHEALISRAAARGVAVPVSLEELRPDLYRTAPQSSSARRSDKRLRVAGAA